MEAFVAAGAGFLLVVLWFDLMDDKMARGHAGDELPPDVIEGISRYDARVTRGASPMNRLVAVAMIGTIAAIVAELVASHEFRAGYRSRRCRSRSSAS